MQQRQVNFRPTWNLTVEEPVAGNYYPVNAITYIKGVNDSRQFTILTGARTVHLRLGSCTIRHGLS